MTPHNYRQQLMDAMVNGLDKVLFYMPAWVEYENDLAARDPLLRKLEASGCGTAACIGGHFELLLMQEGYGADEFSMVEQAHLLEVPENEWLYLCHGWRSAAWPAPRDMESITKDDAIEALERLFAAYPLEES